LATVSNADAYLKIDFDAIEDMSTQKIATVTRQVDSFTKDQKVPVLDEFDLDMNGKELTLRFTETVKASSLDITQLTFQSTETGGSVYQLTNSVRSTVNGATLTVSLSDVDKRNQGGGRAVQGI
jgi:hypothetical protein